MDYTARHSQRDEHRRPVTGAGVFCAWHCRFGQALGAVLRQQAGGPCGAGGVLELWIARLTNRPGRVILADVVEQGALHSTPAADGKCVGGFLAQGAVEAAGKLEQALEPV